MHMGRQQPILFAFWPKQWALEHLSMSVASWSVLCQLERVRCKSQWWYSTLWLGKTWISTYQGRVKCGHDEISPRTLQRQIQRELYPTSRYHSCKEKADGFVYWASRLQKIAEHKNTILWALRRRNSKHRQWREAQICPWSTDWQLFCQHGDEHHIWPLATL